MILLKNNCYEEDEKLFSTGDEELDDILEEVYYSGIEDGYDYAQKEFAEKSKLDFATRQDIKFINKINKKTGSKSEDNIDIYKKFVDDPKVPEKQKKIYRTLIDEENLASGKMSEDDFIKKYPRLARGQHTAEFAALGVSGAAGITGMALANRGMKYVNKDIKKAKKLTKAALVPAAVSAAGFVAAEGIKYHKDKKAEKNK